MSADKVLIGYIYPDQISAHFVSCLISELTANSRIDGVVSQMSGPNLAIGRNLLVQKFLDTGNEWLLMVDTDMVWQRGAVDILLDVADPETVPVVGALCFGMADWEAYPTLYAFDSQSRPVRLRAWPEDSLLTVLATGAAFLLVHRSVLTKIFDHGFSSVQPWFQETEADGVAISEDLTFCLRAVEVGVPIQVHTGCGVGHIKPQVVTAELYIAQQMAKREQEERSESGT